MSDFTLVPEPWWVDPVLEFAHTGKFVSLGEIIPADGAIRLDGDRLAEMDTLLSQHSEKDVQAIRKLIEALSTKGATAAVKRQIADALGDFAVEDVVLKFDPRQGEIALKQARVCPRDIRQWAAFVLASLITYGFADRLAHCELPSCGKTFVQWNRADQKTCSRSHGSQLRTIRSVRKRARNGDEK